MFHPLGETRRVLSQTIEADMISYSVALSALAASDGSMVARVLQEMPPRTPICYGHKMKLLIAVG